MPSSLFHAAIGALIGLAILEEDFDKWALLAILTAALFPDLDAFIAIWIPGAHRVYLHNVFVILVPTLLLLFFTHVRDTGFFELHWGSAGERVAWTCIIVAAVAGIGPDLFQSGVNLFYPVHDQFYRFSGEILYSTQNGLIQTVFDMQDAALGGTETHQYNTGVEPGEQLDTNPEGAGGDASTSADRRFPLFGNGIQLLLSFVTFAIVLYQMRRHGNLSEN